MEGAAKGELGNIPQGSMDELRVLLSEKASDLFAICDQEQKGFVTKRDMQRMRNELPLDPDQLEAVFDSLDADGNSYLTLEEFTEGFGQFLGLEPRATAAGQERQEGEAAGATDAEGGDGETGANGDVDEEEEFNDLLAELGIFGLVDDTETIRAMWLDLKRNDGDPELMAHYQTFLASLARDIQQKETEQENLESTARKRTEHQEKNMAQLNEEMELQLAEERARLRLEEAKKENRLRAEMEGTLELKDRQLQDVMERMRHLEESLHEAKKEVPDIRERIRLFSTDRDKFNL